MDMTTKKNKVYIGGPLRLKKFRNCPLYEKIAEILYDLGLEPYVPHIDTVAPDTASDETTIYKKNLNALNKSLFAVFEISNPSHGVGMEIQYCLSKRIPFICVAKKASNISRMISGAVTSRQIEYYSNINELRVRLAKKLREVIRNDARKIHLFRGNRFYW